MSMARPFYDSFAICPALCFHSSENFSGRNIRHLTIKIANFAIGMACRPIRLRNDGPEPAAPGGNGSIT